MHFYEHIDWIWFCIFSGVTLTINLIMVNRTKNFFTMHLVIKKFSILDLEFPPSAEELVSFIKSIYKLPDNLAVKTLKALKANLYWDFLYMPTLYGSIFILSMNVAVKMSNFGRDLFVFLAWSQLVAWLADIIENIYLLNKIKPEPVVSSPAAHKSYELLEMIKWGIPSVTAVCSIAALFYYWLIGRYAYDSLYYIVILAGEIIIYFIIKKVTSDSEEVELQKFQKVTG